MKQENDYIIRPATLRDIKEICDLNSVWQYENVPENERHLGYLSVKYSEQNIETIIQNNEIVVADRGAKILGYYLLNNFCDTPKYREGYGVIIELKQKGIIDQKTNVGIGAQIAIDKSEQGKGISRKLLEELCKLVKPKYNLLYSSLSKNNPVGYSVHTKEGWKILYESEMCFYVFLTL